MSILPTDEPLTARSSITDDDVEMITKHLPKITGWLDENCAYFSTYLLNYQLVRGVHGPILEFGVYHGKYMALLLHSEKKRGGWVGGYDIFSQSHCDTPMTHFKDIFGTDEGAAVWQANSRDLTPQMVLENIGFKPRFISVDGDHTPEGTEHDLQIAANVGMDEVIIAADDVLNSNAIGASEGLYRFLLQRSGDFVPFSYAYNKMFLCRREFFTEYVQVARSIVDSCPHCKYHGTLKQLIDKHPGAAVQRLMGNDIPIFA